MVRLVLIVLISACFGLRWVAGLTPTGLFFLFFWPRPRAIGCRAFGLDFTWAHPPRRRPVPHPVQHPILKGAWCLEWGQRVSGFIVLPNLAGGWFCSGYPSRFGSCLIFGASARVTSVGGRLCFALGGLLYQALRKLGITGQSPRLKPSLNTLWQQRRGHRGLRTHVLDPPGNSGPAKALGDKLGGSLWDKLG